MNEPRETMVVDANPLLSAMRGGRARAVLFSGKFTFITAEHTTWEVKKYLSELSAKSGVPEDALFYAFDRFPIVAVHPAVYDKQREQAESLIADRDPKDVDVLVALALALKAPIWTEDGDFDDIQEVQVFTTAMMLAKLAALTPLWH